MTRMKTVSIAWMIGALLIGVLLVAPLRHSDAAPGNGSSVNDSAAVLSGQTVKKVTYIDAGVHVKPGTTPIASDSKCSQFGDLHKIEVHLVGTMAGTAPSLSIQPRNSIDGVNWTNVGSAVVINATTTPATSAQTFADQHGASVYNATVAAVVTVPPIAYGDCWDMLTTWGGTGTVTASYSITGIDK